MAKTLDPKTLGLPPRTMLEEIGPAMLAIVINRKSRIIMADGHKILAKAKKIKQNRPETRVLLKTTAPVCGKTLQFLAKQAIEVIRE